MAAAERGLQLLAHGDPAAALGVLHDAVVRGDMRPGTRLNLALAEQHAGDAQAALAAMQALAGEYPDWDEPHLRLAEYFRGQGDAAQAVACYEQTLERAPGRPEALLSLGALMLSHGQIERALALLRRCCSVDPESWQAWDAIGMALRLSGAHQDAYAAFTRAQALAASNVAIVLRLAEAATAAGCAPAAMALLQQQSSDDPLNAVPLAGIAALLADLGGSEASLDTLEGAVALAPDDVVLAQVYAKALIQAGRHHQAAEALRRARELEPQNPAIRNDYATALVRTFRYVEARAEFEALLQSEGEGTFLLCNLIAAELCLGDQNLAVTHARRAAELSPESSLPLRALANAQCYADGASGAAMLDTMRRAGALARRGWLPPFQPKPNPRPEQRLRVGLLSANLATHPVGFLTLAALENLDPAGFELVAVSQPVGHDTMQRRYRSICSEWHVIADQTAAQVRALECDIVLDLGGYGDLGLMVHCAERLAPVQVKWVGMQNHSSGMAEMDWFITDRWETPPGHEHLYSERLLVMPDGYVCYTPPADAPDVGPLPALQRGHVTFGCFNNYAKITAEVIATWCAILQAVPDSRLILKSLQLNHHSTVESCIARFAAHGIDPARIEARGGSAHRTLLQQYGDVDLVLDPFPYSGGLTTCEALWMGVPVLTVPGTTFASRHSTSHLCNVGLQDWIAADLDAYRQQAVRRAADPAALATLRAALRPRMKVSPLCDGPRFGRNLGMALRHAWHDWCARAAP